VPDHLHRLLLPPSSPALPPADHVWPLTTTVLSTRHCAELEERADAPARRCVILPQRRDRIRSATRFPWWSLRIKKQQGPRTT
jgi:hypothetical protein